MEPHANQDRRDVSATRSSVPRTWVLIPAGELRILDIDQLPDVQEYLRRTLGRSFSGNVLLDLSQVELVHTSFFGVIEELCSAVAANNGKVFLFTGRASPSAWSHLLHVTTA